MVAFVTRPAAVLLAELRVHVRNAAAGTNPLAVFLPKQCESYTLLGEFLMDVPEVRHGIRRSIRIPPGKQDLLDILVGDRIIQWPGDPGCGSLDKNR